MDLLVEVPGKFIVLERLLAGYAGEVLWLNMTEISREPAIIYTHACHIVISVVWRGEKLSWGFRHCK